MRRFARETQHYYIRDVERFARWLGRSPHTATTEDVRRFQIEQQDAGMPVPTMNMMVSALRFFFTQTLDRPDLSRKLVRTRYERKIPTVLSMGEEAATGSHDMPETSGGAVGRLWSGFARGRSFQAQGERRRQQADAAAYRAG
jgi:site-specific recombinase XerD